MYSKSPTIKHIDSPLKLKLSSAITPSIGDSDFLHLESQNKLKPQSCDQPFDENKYRESSRTFKEASYEFELPSMSPKLQKIPSSESMKMPLKGELRRRSNNYFSNDFNDDNSAHNLEFNRNGRRHHRGFHLKKQLQITFQQIELSLRSMMIRKETQKSKFTRIIERGLTAFGILRPSIQEKFVPAFKNNMSLNERIDIPNSVNIVDILIKKHIDFLGNQRHLFQVAPSWLKAIMFIISDFLQAILSLMSCVLYILSTYVSAGSENSTFTKFIHISDYIITALFTLDLVRHFAESKNKVKFFFKLHSIIDILAIMPIYLMLLFQVQQTALGFLHILQIFRIIRILRLYRLFKEYEVEGSDKIDNSLNDSRFSLQKQMAILICTVFALLFISAGVSYELDGIFNDTYTITKMDSDGKIANFKDIYTFFYAFYLVFQTMFSVGYGDVVPSASSSRIFICILVFLFIFILIDQIMKVYEIKSKTSPWDFEYRRQKHIVIIGMFNENSLLRILQEVFKLEEERKIKNILLIRSTAPSIEIMNLMENPIYEGKVSYLMCNLLSEAMIKKANIKRCREVFLVNESSSSNSYQQDKMLTSLMHLIQECFPFIPKILRVSDPEIAKRFYGYLNHWTPWNKVFSTITIKEILMVENIFNQGFTTIFSNFFCSNRLLSMHKELPNINWYMEYGASLLQEIFCVKISSFFHGRNFNQVVQLLSKTKSRLNSEGLLFIGVKTKYSDEEYDTRTTILINPQDYCIKSDDLGIVIATNRERAEFLTYFDLEAEELSMTNFVDENEDFSARKESIKKEYDLMNMNNDSFSVGKFLSSDILLWKEDISEKISGHIILFYAESFCESVVVLLRARTKKPIIFYSENKPDDRWNRLTTHFSNIYFAQGDVFDIMHLRNCGIQKAFHVCIFNKMTISSNDYSTPDCLLLANLIDEYFPIPYTIETNDQNELKFLSHKPKKFIADLGVQFYPMYMAGQSCVLNILDSLVSFSSSNPISLDVFIHLFVYNENRRHTTEHDGDEEWETQNQNIHVFENLQIKTIRCPEAYKNKCYQDLLIDFCSLKPSLIPIGILTQRYTQVKKEKGSSIKKINHNVSINFFQFQSALEEELDENSLPTPLTLTNPLPTTVLNETDRIIIIGNFTHIPQSLDGESITPGNNENIDQKINVNDGISESMDEDKLEKEENNKKLLSLMNLTLSGKKKIIRKIEEKNQMIKNLMEEIERKKKGYAKLMTIDNRKV